MSGDFRPPPAGRRGGGLNPLFVGLIIGLLLGVSLSLGVALWLNRNAIPFMERSKPLEPPPKLEAKATKPEAGKAADSSKTPDKPRFEFYQILPGDKPGSDKSADTKPVPRKSEDLKAPDKTAEKAADKVVEKSVSKPVEKPADKPAEKAQDKTPDKAAEKPIQASRELIFLQAGAFQSESDADNLKARIAFIGLQAKVVEAKLPDKGQIFRVRLGPYQSLDDVNRIKRVLSENGINAAVVKNSDTLN